MKAQYIQDKMDRRNEETKDLESQLKKVKNKTEMSELVGKAIAKKAKTKKIGSVVLDRNGSPYHGRVKAFAEAARKNGLEL